MGWNLYKPLVIDTNSVCAKGPIDQEGGVSLLQRNDVKLESNETKKQRKKDDRLRDKTLEQLMGEDLGTSPAVSGLHTETEAQRKKKKKAEKRNAKLAQERQMAKQAAAEALAGSTPTKEDGNLITDAKPTPVNPERLEPASSEDEDMEDGGAPLLKGESGYTAPPSGVNRAIRRRFMLIEREKAKIKKDLGVPEGSDDKAEEVNQLLDQFIEGLDTKTAERDSRKKDRKRREAARNRDRRSKLLEKTTMKERREKPKVLRDD